MTKGAHDAYRAIALKVYLPLLVKLRGMAVGARAAACLPDKFDSRRYQKAFLVNSLQTTSTIKINQENRGHPYFCGYRSVVGAYVRRLD